LSSFAETYDRYRPRPPQALLELLTRLAEVERPELVIDLGTGTGLSARAWTGRAERVVGIEPDDAMRAVGEARGGGVEYVAATAYATGLPDGCADIVTCSQSLHWMDPEPTFAEVARILRPGGIFSAYDYDAIPVIHPEVDAAYDAVMEAAKELRKQTGRISPWTTRGPLWKADHLQRMRDSGRFRFTREFVVHSVEEGGAERLIGAARSMGAIEMHKDELPLAELERVARRAGLGRVNAGGLGDHGSRVYGVPWPCSGGQRGGERRRRSGFRDSGPSPSQRPRSCPRTFQDGRSTNRSHGKPIFPPRGGMRTPRTAHPQAPSPAAEAAAATTGSLASRARLFGAALPDSAAPRESRR